MSGKEQDAQKILVVFLFYLLFANFKFEPWQEKSKMLRSLFLVFLLINSTFAQKPALTNLPTASQISAPAKNWTTLSGW